jgi:DNA-binding cell septation regulator SpoVG
MKDDMDGVTVIEVRLARKPGSLRAFVDVKLGNLLVTDFRVFQTDGGPARVEVPMVTWRDPGTRELRFKPVITLPGELMGRVQAEILSCYYRLREGKQDGRSIKQTF